RVFRGWCWEFCFWWGGGGGWGGGGLGGGGRLGQVLMAFLIASGSLDCANPAGKRWIRAAPASKDRPWASRAQYIPAPDFMSMKKESGVGCFSRPAAGRAALPRSGPRGGDVRGSRGRFLPH